MNEANILSTIARAGHFVDMERPTATLDELGGRSLEWQSVAAGVAAWVQPVAAETREDYARRGMTVTHSVYFATDPSIEVGDRIIFRGRKLVVAGVTDAGGAGRLWKAVCRENT